MLTGIAPEAERKINRYINLLRNPDKRRYAAQYMAWLRGGAVGHEPTRGRLSYMATQAVRQEISEMNPWG